MPGRQLHGTRRPAACLQITGYGDAGGSSVPQECNRIVPACQAPATAYRTRLPRTDVVAIRKQKTGGRIVKRIATAHGRNAIPVRRYFHFIIPTETAPAGITRRGVNGLGRIGSHTHQHQYEYKYPSFHPAKIANNSQSGTMRHLIFRFPTQKYPCYCLHVSKYFLFLHRKRILE